MKAAIVTGASGAIGSAICKAFKAEGYHVVGTDLVPGAPCDAFVKADLAAFATDPKARKAIIASLQNAVGKAKLAALVNNAATQRLGKTKEVTQADWDATMAVNVTAPFFLVQAFAQDLETNQGSVVNVASIHARLTKPRFVSYATSKSALTGLTRALAVDLGGRVRVNAILPAAIDTDMLRAGFQGKPGAFRRLAEFHPANTLGTAEGIGSFVVSIAEGNQFLTGAIVNIDGAVGSRLHDPEGTG